MHLKMVAEAYFSCAHGRHVVVAVVRIRDVFTEDDGAVESHISCTRCAKTVFERQVCADTAIGTHDSMVVACEESQLMRRCCE